MIFFAAINPKEVAIMPPTDMAIIVNTNSSTGMHCLIHQAYTKTIYLSNPVLPSCPTETGHFFDYLECAWPEERSYQQDKGQGNLDIATIITAYCEEEIAEWLPILDRGVKKSTLELREYGMAKLEGERSVSGTTAEEWDSLDMQDDFAAVLAIYIRGPVMAGFWGQTGGCIPLFQSLEEGAFIEMIKKELKEK